MLERFFSKPDADTTGPVVVLVGHCGFDAPGLTRLAKTAGPDVAVARVNTQAQLDAYRRPDALWLVNRVLDGRFEHESGIELIAQAVAALDGPAAMLISNYPDAQAAAQQAGALPGFGKSQANAPETRQQLADAIAALA